jgi:WD40 repeat protein
VVTGDGTRAITTSKDHATRVWRLASGRVAHTVSTSADVSSMYARPGRTHVVASTTDGRAQVWDADNAAPIMDLPATRTALVTSFATNNDGTVGVGGDTDGGATVWDLTAGEPVLRLPCRDLVTAVAITPDAHTAATGSLHGDVMIWDLATGNPRGWLPGETTVTSLALTPDGGRLLVGCDTLAVYALSGEDRPRPLARLFTSHRITAAVINPAMPDYALFGAAGGQVSYVRLPMERPRHHSNSLPSRASR